MLTHIRPALAMMAVMTVVTGLLYPLGMTGLAQVLFPAQANGSLVAKDGRIVGSALIGQNFTAAKYFRGRPSATAPEPYNAGASSGANLGPTSEALIARVGDAAEKLKSENQTAAVPLDLVTTSASGLDPHIAPAAALFQAPRVAKERGLAETRVRELIAAHTEGRLFDILGEPRVNVLKLNLALDALQ